MKKICILNDDEIAVIGAIRKIEEIEKERSGLVIAYDKFIRANGFRNFTEAVNDSADDDIDNKIRQYEKKLMELDDKVRAMKSKIGLYL